MRLLETEWWQIALPDEWDASQDEESVVIGDADGLGSISITTLKATSPEAAIEDLEGIIADLGLDFARAKKVRVGSFKALYFESEEDNDFIREWFATHAELMIMISYECDIDDRDMDRSAVDEILGTLEICETLKGRQDARR